jgi:hypothetical protein
VITSRGLGAGEDATLEQVEIGAAEHLALEHRQPVDVPFDRSPNSSAG